MSPAMHSDAEFYSMKNEDTRNTFVASQTSKFLVENNKFVTMKSSFYALLFGIAMQ